MFSRSDPLKVLTCRLREAYYMGEIHGHTAGHAGSALFDGTSPMTTTIGSIRNSSQDGSWLTFTYTASNSEAQRLIAELLGNFRDIEVNTRTAGDEPLVIVKCPNPQRAESLHDVIVTLDWGARPKVAPVSATSDAMTA
jgi:hypothetical protein